MAGPFNRGDTIINFTLLYLQTDTADFLTARRLPWSLREYLIGFGGVDKYRRELWDKTLALKYMMFLMKGTSAVRALSKALKCCQEEILHMAYEAGYIREDSLTVKETYNYHDVSTKHTDCNQ